ncbi:MAG: hypothetical protein AB7E96_07010 [Deferribacterales bacterium]
MPKIDLSDFEAKLLIKMEKECCDEKPNIFPGCGGKLNILLKSKCGKEEFTLDVYRGKIELTKNTFQNRARKAIVLVRLDIGGAPHRNPDGTEIPCPHIHIYKEGYHHKWAYAVPEKFSDLTDSWETLQDFMDYVNVTKKPYVQKDINT